MRVLQLVKYYFPSLGGMETVVKNIVEGVSEVRPDINFTVYSNHNKRNAKKIQVENNIQVIKETTPFFFKSQPLNLMYSSLQKLISEHDIVHHHYPFPNMELALARNINILKNKKLIITWHANIQNSRWKMLAKVYDPFIEQLLDIAEHIVVTSPQLSAYSNVLKNYESKIVVIPLSFTPNMGCNDSKPKSISLNIPRKVLFVGKLRAYKGLPNLINAIFNTDYLLTIVGEGEEEALLKRQVENLNIGSRVTFLKGVDDNKLAELYKQADLFVLPSISEAEAFGVVQLEAMANGLPVINTDLKSGVPYVSLNNVTGLTVKPQNVEQLTNALKTILNDEELYAKFSANSIERSKLFSRDKLANEYAKLYHL